MTNPRTGSSLVVLSLTLLVCMESGAQGKEDGCQPEVRVARNSVVFAEEKKTVTIHCPFKHCGVDVNLTWCKVDRATFCQPLHHFREVKIELIEGDTHTATSTLTFTNITSEDDGLYRCRFSIDGKQMSSVSHSINVSVTPPIVHGTNVSSGSITRSPQEKMVTKGQPAAPEWLAYIYICLGIASLVAIIVVISFLSMKCCEESKHSEKAEHSHNQHTAPLASYQASPRPSLPNRPRSLRTNPVRHPDECTDNNHFGRRASRNKRGPSGGGQPTESGVSGQGAVAVKKSGLHDNCSEGTDQESGVIVYAALNHKAPRDASCTVALEEQHSEYAAIRIT